MNKYEFERSQVQSKFRTILKSYNIVDSTLEQDLQLHQQLLKRAPTSVEIYNVVKDSPTYIFNKNNLHLNENFINKLDNTEIWYSLRNKLIQALTDSLKDIKKKSQHKSISRKHGEKEIDIKKTVKNYYGEDIITYSDPNYIFYQGCLLDSSIFDSINGILLRLALVILSKQFYL